jgi:type III restriction enzyme
VLDTHPLVNAFVKNAGLGFAMPYLHNGQVHDYVPDFIVRLKTEPAQYLVLETKGFDPLEGIKVAAAMRWVAAVNADGTYGAWGYAIVKKIAVPTDLDSFDSGNLGHPALVLLAEQSGRAEADARPTPEMTSDYRGSSGFSFRISQ